MLISEIAKIVIFEVNLDHPAPETPPNHPGPKIDLFFFVYGYFATEYIFFLGCLC